MGQLYKHSKDIDRDAHFDAEDVDRIAFKVVSRTSKALESSTSLDPIARDTIARLLDAMLATHRSIRMLFKLKEEDNGRHRPAGLSLVREQVEVLFALALMATDPTKWSVKYHRSAYAEGWIDLLEEEHQCGTLESFDEFLNTTGIQMLESIRVAHGVSEDERDALKQSFEDWLSGARPNPIPKEWQYPTPSGVLREKALGARSRKLLQVWYRQYRVYCRHAHVRLEKLIMFRFEANKHNLSESDRENFLQNKYVSACCISWLAIGTVCTVLLDLLKEPEDVLVGLDEFWAHFRDMSLLGRELWDTSIGEVMLADRQA